MSHYENKKILNVEGYEIYFTRYSEAILSVNFQDALNELESVLSSISISKVQITTGGGGLSSITSNIRDAFYEFSWQKQNVKSVHTVNDRVLMSESHEVDHYKTFESGNIGLEIEWNNKDPFFDRDLENFRKLYLIEEISLGIIITKGASLQEYLFEVFVDRLAEIENLDLRSINDVFDLSDKAKAKIEDILDSNISNEDKISNVASLLYRSKYGTATTHMNKLLLRIERGLGNPCPLILIGIGSQRVV